MPWLTNYVSRKQKTALTSVMSNGSLAVLLLTALTVSRGVETYGCFGKSVVLDGVLLGQAHEGTSR